MQWEFKYFMNMETKHLIVKPTSLDNFENVYSLYSDPEIMRYVGRGVKTAQETRESIEKMIQHQEKHGFSSGDIYEKETGLFVGRGGLIYLELNDNQPEIEVGYILLKKFWQKGYATELAKAFLEWGFKHLSVKKLVAVIHPENEASRRVLEKAGMYYVGRTHCWGIEVAKYEIYSSVIDYKKVQIIPATLEDYTTIQNMGRFYSYDIVSQCKMPKDEMKWWKFNENGTYDDLEFLKRYWEEKEKYPFIVRLNEERVGFVLINKIVSSEDVNWNMGEFFISKKFQGKGIAKYVAFQCFDKFSGTWEVMVLPGNEHAYRFWRTIIKQYTNNSFEEYSRILPFKNNQSRNIFKLNSKK